MGFSAACKTQLTGNAVILRGGRTAQTPTASSPRATRAPARSWAAARGGVVLTPDRRELEELLKQRRYVDLIIPRGGEELKVSCRSTARCRSSTRPAATALYVDAGADLEKATRIVINAKCQRPGVCNAAETLLVHADVAAAFLPTRQTNSSGGAWLVVDKAAADLLGDPSRSAPTRRTTTTEFLDLKLAVHVVDRWTRPSSTSPPTARATLKPSSPKTWPRRGVHGGRGRGLRLRQRVRHASRTAASSGWARRWASPRRSCTRADLSRLQELTTVKYELWGDGQVRG